MPVEVKVWSAAAVAGADTATGTDPAALSEDEQARIARLRRPQDRALVAAGWRLARSVLGAELGEDPAALEFTRTCRTCGHPDHGKPRLADDGPSFNLSHASGTVLLAVCERAEVGVDLEPRSADLREVAAAVLTDTETAAGIDPLTAWVRKEAVLKADGRGLAVPMTDLDLTRPLEGFAVVDLDVEGYAAALAVAGGEPPVARWPEPPQPFVSAR